MCDFLSPARVLEDYSLDKVRFLTSTSVAEQV